MDIDVIPFEDLDESFGRWQRTQPRDTLQLELGGADESACWTGIETKEKGNGPANREILLSLLF